jgi:hypothetical protein
VLKYGLQDITMVKTFVEPGKFLGKSTVEATPEFRAHYQALIRSLNYLAARTRFDISYGFGLVSRFMSNPNEEHLR